MSVSSELLCSFELLKPLDSSALKSHIKKGRNKRNSTLNSPVSHIRIVVDTELILHSLPAFFHKAFNSGFFQESAIELALKSQTYIA